MICILPSDVLNYIIEFITGKSKEMSFIIESYASGLYITVPNEIRLTFLRRYLRNYNVPNDYLILPFSIVDINIDEPKLQTLKIVNMCTDIQSLFGPKLYLLELPLNKLILPKVDRISLIRFCYDNYKTLVKIGDVNIRLDYNKILKTNTKNIHDYYVKYYESKLTISNTVIQFIESLASNITELNIIDVSNQMLFGFIFVDKPIFDNITILTTKLNASYLWYYPKSLIRHNIIDRNDNQSYILVDPSMTKPVIFSTSSYSLCISVNHANYVYPSSNITTIVIDDNFGNGTLCEKVNIEIDLSSDRFDKITYLHTHDSVKVKYPKNLKKHLFFKYFERFY